MQGPARGSQTQAIFDLLAAHRELGAIEWLELRQSIVRAAVWATLGILTAASGFLALNLLVVACFREQPVIALSTLALVDGLVALLCVLRVRRLIDRPFFSASRVEVARDVRNLMRGMT